MVVQTDDEPLALARRLAAAGLGAAIDLRAPGEPITPEIITEVARQLALASVAERREQHREREQEIRGHLAAASEHHTSISTQVDRAAERRRRLLEGAAWCEGRRAVVAELVAARDDADATIEAAIERVADAEAALRGAIELRAGHQAIVTDGQQQLEELERAGRSVDELQRSLDTARQALEEADAAATTARRQTEALHAELAAAVAERDRLALALAAGGDAADSDMRAVADALDRLQQAPLVAADPATAKIAEDLEQLGAELAAYGRFDPGPEPEEIDAAEMTVAVAREHLDDLRRPPAPVEPPLWWDELARLHARVVDAQSAAGAGFARKSAHRRLEEAIAAERAFLDELGYPSHLDALLSGGRPKGQVRPGLLSIADAEQALVVAEQRLFELRSRSAGAAAPRTARSNLLRRRALAGALLGIPAAAVTVERLRAPRPDPALIESLWVALAAAGCTSREQPIVDIAEAWLAAAGRSVDERARMADGLEAAAALVDHLEAQRPGAEADAAAYAAAADEAARQVALLETDLAASAALATDPAAREAKVAELRARIDAARAELDTLGDVTDADLVAARTGVEDARERQDAAAKELVGLAEHAESLAGLLDGHPTGEPLADLTGLAAVLRAEVSQLDLGLADAGRAVAAASAAVAHARADLAGHQGRTPTDPVAADRAEALRTLLAVEDRTTDLVVEPMLDVDADDWQLLIDAITEVAAAQRVVLVASDPRFVAWAKRQPGNVVEVVTAAAVDPGPSLDDRIRDAHLPH